MAESNYKSEDKGAYNTRCFPLGRYEIPKYFQYTPQTMLDGGLKDPEHHVRYAQTDQAHQSQG